MTSTIRSDLQEAVAELRRRGIPKPSIALILGSGLGNFANEISNPISVSAAELPGYPTSTVEGHAGRLVFGRIIEGTRTSPDLLVFQGRVHFYETGEVERTTAPVRLAAALGVDRLFITNAAGGINRSFKPGDLMLMTDLLAPLPPPSGTVKGSRQSPGPFDDGMMRLLKETARQERIDLKEGTYCWLQGPSYETAAEIRMLGILGTDAVGMSTVPEVEAATDLGMKIAGISLISNMGTGISPTKLSHAEVTETASQASTRFTRLLRSFLTQL